MRGLMYVFSVFLIMSLVFGTILAVGGNHVGDFIIVIAAVGSILCLSVMEDVKG